MNLGDLERNLIQAARGELGPSAADRERNESELFERLGGSVGAPLGGGSSVGASGALPRAALSRAALSRAALSLQGSRVAMLGLGLIVGAAVGGWLGFGLGQSGWRAARERMPAAERTSPKPGASFDGLAPGDLDPGALGEPPRASDVTPDDIPGAGGSEQRGPPDGTGDGLPSLLPTSPGIDPKGARSAASSARGVRAIGPRPAKEAQPSSLAAEIAMLQRARRALNAENGRLAVGIVQELDEQFPRGVLMEERNATRVLGLCQLGQIDEARRMAHSFVEQYPGSVYAERVRRACVVDPEE
jgi:hypothetical protein